MSYYRDSVDIYTYLSTYYRRNLNFINSIIAVISKTNGVKRYVVSDKK